MFGDTSVWYEARPFNFYTSHTLFRCSNCNTYWCTALHRGENVQKKTPALASQNCLRQNQLTEKAGEGVEVVSNYLNVPLSTTLESIRANAVLWSEVNTHSELLPCLRVYSSHVNEFNLNTNATWETLQQSERLHFLSSKKKPYNSQKGYPFYPAKGNR